MTDETHDHDLGLTHDFPVLLERRRLLQLLAAAGAGLLAGCGSDDTASSTSATTATQDAPAGATATTVSTTSANPTDSPSTDTAAADGTTSCAVIPEETAGPYPGDGSNGPNVLAESGIVRSDITASFGETTTVAEGIPLTINLTLLDTADGCEVLSGAAVYLWHCDRDGLYSMYSEGVEDENYLRGVQESDANGRVSFTSIFPACYSGRWPHIHFEVYESADAATSGGIRYATSQVAIPQDACSQVYATAGYAESIETLARVSLESDNVFADDAGVSQLASADGSVDAGYTLELTVPIDTTTTSSGSAGGRPAGGGDPPNRSMP